MRLTLLGAQAFTPFLQPLPHSGRCLLAVRACTLHFVPLPHRATYPNQPPCPPGTRASYVAGGALPEALPSTGPGAYPGLTGPRIRVPPAPRSRSREPPPPPWRGG
jgi:hypothetical protein